MRFFIIWMLLLLAIMAIHARIWEALPEIPSAAYTDFMIFDKPTGRVAIDCRKIPLMPYRNGEENYMEVISPVSVLCEQLGAEPKPALPARKRRTRA